MITKNVSVIILDRQDNETRIIFVLLPLIIWRYIMTLLQLIKQKLQDRSDTKLLASMGYNNLEKGRVTLRSLLDAQELYLWLKEGHFDLRYTGREFVIKLCAILEVSEIDYLVILDQYEQRAREITYTPSSYIFAYTGFRRKNEPIFVLALMERSRRLYLDKEILYNLDEEQRIKYVSLLIQEHYEETKGELTLWGKIKSYVFFFENEKGLVFDTQGQVKEECEPPTQVKAELKIKNKLLF